VTVGPRWGTTGDSRTNLAPGRAPCRARNAADFAILAGELLAVGYQPQAPTPGAARIDTQFAADATCAECGAVGLAYQPFSRADSYIAFVHCQECGAAEEF